MSQELIMYLVALVSVIIVWSYFLFSPIRTQNRIIYKKNKTCLGSENTDSYFKGTDIFEELHQNENKANFKGDYL